MLTNISQQCLKLNILKLIKKKKHIVLFIMTLLKAEIFIHQIHKLMNFLKIIGARLIIFILFTQSLREEIWIVPLATLIIFCNLYDMSGNDGFGYDDRIDVQFWNVPEDAWT